MVINDYFQENNPCGEYKPVNKNFLFHPGLRPQQIRFLMEAKSISPQRFRSEFTKYEVTYLMDWNQIKHACDGMYI